MTIPVVLTINGDQLTGDLYNRAEIAAADATDENGDVLVGVVDGDSTPDSDQTNDMYVTDNDIDGNGMAGEDEDDHDPAMITLAEFDLALTKQLVGTGPWKPGDEAIFQITVTNQGDLTAYNVNLIDYAESGLNYLPSNAFNTLE